MQAQKPAVLEPKIDGVTVAVRLTPKASADRLLGVIGHPSGATALRVAVTAVPEKGKANAALVKLLAKAWSLPKTSLTVISGATDRNKVLHIKGDPVDLTARIDAVLSTLSD